MRVLAGEVKKMNGQGISLMPELVAVGLIYHDEKNWLNGTCANNSGKETILEVSNYLNKESFSRFCLCKGDRVVFEELESFDD